MKFVRTVLISLLVLIGMSGCSSIPALEQLVKEPQLSVDRFGVSEASLLKQAFTVRLKVDNPNLFSIPVLGLNYGLDIGGVQVAKGSHDKKVTIPAGGSEFLELDINTNLLKSLPDLSTLVMGGMKALDYTVTGDVKTNSSLIKTIPFKKTGEFDLKFR